EETIKRAVGKKSKGFSDIFFYFVVILWGFLPYSLFFYYSFIKAVKSWDKRLFLPLAWVITMLVIFTIAKGKIPVYLIQAHGGMSLLVGYYLANHNPVNKLDKVFFYVSLFIPVVITAVAVGGLIYLFKLDYILYIAVLFPFAYLLRYKEIRMLPFITTLILFFIFTVSVLPIVERYRPYDRIGLAVNDNVPEKNIPLYVEGYFWHNLPFYAKRKVYRDIPQREILKMLNEKPVLALVKEDTYYKINNAQLLWSGWLYRRGSESRFAVLLKYIHKAMGGDYSGFEKRYLILKR
ncbi:MAG: glycosyltransferase family 39 protein, partial [Aquificae bacterium]|nr:glycosyltransferase family 39 protein [Aquificota bacterium]